MEERDTSLRKHRVPTEKRKECLKLFEEGYGYKKTAQLAGLNTYTVRDYKRRYASGDNSWADRGGNMVTRGAMPQGTTLGQIGAGTWFPSEYAGAGFGQCPSVTDGNALRCIAMRIGSIPRFLD